MIKKLVLLSAILALGTAWLSVTPTVQAQALFYDQAKQVTSLAGAVTVSAQSATVTTETLATANATDYTLTVTDDRVKSANAVVFVGVNNGSNTTAGCSVSTVTPTTGQLVIKIRNNGAGVLNGTLKISFILLTPG